jgi:hypothetical protein
MVFSDTSKRRLFYALAIALLLIATAGMVLGQYNFVIRSTGLLALFGSLKLFQVARSVGQSRLRSHFGEAQTPRQRPGTDSLGPFSGEKAAPSSVAWMVAGGSVATFFIAYYFLFQDAQHGHSQAWPVYLFFASVWVCIMGTGYLISKIM